MLSLLRCSRGQPGDSRLSGRLDCSMAAAEMRVHACAGGGGAAPLPANKPGMCGVVVMMAMDQRFCPRRRASPWLQTGCARHCSVHRWWRRKDAHGKHRFWCYRAGGRAKEL